MITSYSARTVIVLKQHILMENSGSKVYSNVKNRNMVNMNICELSLKSIPNDLGDYVAYVLCI